MFTVTAIAQKHMLGACVTCLLTMYTLIMKLRGVFAGIVVSLIRVIYAQSENRCIESARRHAVSHAQGKRCHMLGPCTEVRHLARFHDDLNRSSSQHSYSCYMQEDHLVCPGMCGSVAAFST